MRHRLPDRSACKIFMASNGQRGSANRQGLVHTIRVHEYRGLLCWASKLAQLTNGQFNSSRMTLLLGWWHRNLNSGGQNQLLAAPS